MTLRPSLALALFVLFVASLTTFGCGGSSTPSGPSSNAPVVRSLAPTNGTTFGGTQVTITGEQFVAGSTVTFGGVAGVNVGVENGTTIRVTTPAHASGTVDVQVSGSTGSGMLAQGFTFTTPGGTNAPPVIKSLTAKGRRTNEPTGFADLGETVDVTAVVEDAETPLDKLTFQWTATAGTMSGSGPVVTWAAPSTASTPVDVTLTLTVVETYKAPDSSGLPVDKENKVTGTTNVTLHNSTKEIANMAEDFLLAFSNSAITDPNKVLQDFTSSCSGTDNERTDVLRNRAERKIQKYTAGSASVTVNFGGSCTLFSDRYRPGDGCAVVPWEWWSTVIGPPGDPNLGMTDHTKGTDQVVAIYKSPRWWLCDSDWKTTLQEFTK